MNNYFPITRNLTFTPVTTPTTNTTTLDLRIARDDLGADGFDPGAAPTTRDWQPVSATIGGSDAREEFATAVDTLTGDLYADLRNASGAASVEGAFIPAFDELARIRHRIRQGEAVPRDELEEAVQAARAGLQDAMAGTSDPAFDAAAQRAIGVLDGLSFEDGDTATTALLGQAEHVLDAALEGGGLVSDLVDTATNETPDLLQNQIYELLTGLQSGDVTVGHLRQELGEIRRDLRGLARGGSDAATALLTHLESLRPFEQAQVVESLQNGQPSPAHALIPRTRISG